MRRTLWPASALLAALTAVALLGIASSIRPPGPSIESAKQPGVASRARVHAFYGAINGAIETGDLAPLKSLVAPHLLDSASPTPDEAGNLTLGRRLRALHATFPTLLLSVESLAVDGDLAIVHIRAKRSPGSSFLGLALTETPEPWGPIDILRIANDRIVEVNSPGAGANLLEPTIAVSRAVPAEKRLVITARRVTLEPGARFEGAAAGWPHLLWIERGAATITVLNAAPHPFTTETFTTADYAILPPGLVYRAQNAAGETTVLLDLRVDRVDGSRRVIESGPETSGAGMTALGDVHLFGSSSGEMNFAIGRVTLASGARLGWAESERPVLVCVERGTVRLDADPNLPRLHDGTIFGAGADGALAPATARGVFVPINHAVSIAALDGPATVLIVTLPLDN